MIINKIKMIDVKTIITLAVVIAGVRSKEMRSGISNCAKYKEDWRISECASGLKRDGLISKFLYNNYLDMAKTTGAATTTFYGVGITWGLENRLIAGSIKEPKFEKSVSMKLEASSLYFDTKLIDIGHEFDKPVALFVVNEVKGVPAWEGKFMSGWQKSGMEEIAALYRTEDSGPVNLRNTQERCSEFTQWIHDNLIVRKKGVAILMGPNQWCPVIKSSVMELVVAETHEVEVLTMTGEREMMTVVKSAVWKDGAFGDPSEELKSVFQ